MDKKTKEVVENFIRFFDEQLKQHKHLSGAQVEKYSVNGFKVSVKVFNNNSTETINFDLREITENANNFSHLLSNGIDQLTKKY